MSYPGTSDQDRSRAREVVVIDASLEPLVPKFLEHRMAETVALAEHLAASDFEAVRRIAHTVKGVGGSYGFDRISEIAAVMEQGAKAGDGATVARTVYELRSYLERIDVVY